MLAPSLDHARFEELLLRLSDAVQLIPRRRDFTPREQELLNRLHVHLGSAVPKPWDTLTRARRLDATSDREALHAQCLLAVFDSLTRAESELVILLREGLSNKEIAARLGKSVRTVKTQLTSVYKKFCVRSRSRLLALLV